MPTQIKTLDTSDQERQALHAYLSETAHGAWNALSEDTGVSVTGMLEAIGQQMYIKMEENPDADPEDLFEEWVKHGRKIDAQRRRRGPARAA